MLLHHMAIRGRTVSDGASRNYVTRQVSWQLDLDEDGTVQRLTALTAGGSDKLGVPHVIPDPNRTSGIAAGIGADTAEYVLGWPRLDEKTKQPTEDPKTRQRHQAFRDLNVEWAREHSDDPVPHAIQAFFHSGQIVERPANGSGSHYLLITVAGVAAPDAHTAAGMWASLIDERKGSHTADGARVGICLLCAQSGPLANTIPGSIPSRLVPGLGTKGALTSINARAFGYELTTGLRHAPICLDCAGAVSVGATHMLSRHAIGLPGQDFRFVWWTVDDQDDDAAEALFDLVTDPAGATETPVGKDEEEHKSVVGSAHDVARLLGAIHGGFVPDPDGTLDVRRIMGATLGGNQSRVMIRDWVNMPIVQLVHNIRAWMDDHRTGDRVYPLWLLISACGRYDNGKKRYLPLGAKGEQRPHLLGHDLTRAALQGTPIPLSIANHVISRVLNDRRVDSPRAAILQLFLSRRTDTGTPMPTLTTDSTDPAYLCGRLLARLEAFQRASNNGQSPNKSFVDRMIGLAVMRPKEMVKTGLTDVNRAWLPKLRRSNPGLATVISRELDDLLGQLDTAQLPDFTNTNQRCNVLMGLHHERRQIHNDIQERKAAKAAASDASDPDITILPSHGVDDQ